MTDDIDKAYGNSKFLNSPDGRPLRILSEYLEPASRFARYKVDDTIVFFGSSRAPSAEDVPPAAKASKGKGKSEGNAKADKRQELAGYYEAARELARRLTEWSKGLDKVERRFVICSGGGPGIMEAANRGASEAQGINVGLNISIPAEPSGNPHATRELTFEFHYFFMRKFWFAYLAKAVVVFPGGFGTLDELFELLTLIQTHKIRKRLPIVLFGQNYWRQVINFEALVDYGTISRDDLNLFFETDSVDEAFDFITSELKEYALSHPGMSL